MFRDSNPARPVEKFEQRASRGRIARGDVGSVPMAFAYVGPDESAWNRSGRRLSSVNCLRVRPHAPLVRAPPRLELVLRSVVTNQLSGPWACE